MATQKKCPLCGKRIHDDSDLCRDCKDSVEHRNEELSFSNLEKEKTLKDTASGSQENTPPQKVNKTLILYLVLCIVLVGLGLGVTFWVRNYQNTQKETEKTFWEETVRINTPLEYSKYLVRFPNGIYADEARNKISELRHAEQNEWSEAKESNDIIKISAFISTYPNSPFLEEAKNIMDSLSWMNTMNLNTPEDYLAYIGNVEIGNFSGNYIDEARQRYKYLSNLIVLTGPALDSIKLIVSDFFKAMSNTDSKKASTLSENQISPYFENTNISPNDIIKQIKSQKEKQIKEISFIPDTVSLKFTQDTTGIIKGRVPLTISVEYKNKKKDISREKIFTSIELSKNKRIKGISKMN